MVYRNQFHTDMTHAVNTKPRTWMRHGINHKDRRRNHKADRLGSRASDECNEEIAKIDASSVLLVQAQDDNGFTSSTLGCRADWSMAERSLLSLHDWISHNAYVPRALSLENQTPWHEIFREFIDRLSLGDSSTVTLLPSKTPLLDATPWCYSL